jgi:hypothetical protein
MSLLWSFLLAVGFFVVIMMSVPEDKNLPDDPPPFSAPVAVPSADRTP